MAYLKFLNFCQQKVNLRKGKVGHIVAFLVQIYIEDNQNNDKKAEML